MFEEELDSHGRNIKALCLWICVVPVKCLVHEASLIKVNYTLTLSHCKHSPSVSFPLPASLSLSLFFTNTPSLLFGSALPSVWCVFWEFQGVVLCLCVPASPLPLSPTYLHEPIHFLLLRSDWSLVEEGIHLPPRPRHFTCMSNCFLAFLERRLPSSVRYIGTLLINPCVLFSLGWVIALLFLPPYWSAFMCSWFSGPAYRNHFHVSVIIRVRWC